MALSIVCMALLLGGGLFLCVKLPKRDTPYVKGRFSILFATLSGISLLAYIVLLGVEFPLPDKIISFAVVAVFLRIGVPACAVVLGALYCWASRMLLQYFLVFWADVLLLVLHIYAVMGPVMEMLDTAALAAA